MGYWLTWSLYNVIVCSVTSTQMQSVQLSSRLRYLPLSDEEGEFGLLIVHTGDTINYTIEVANSRELEAAIESFQSNPVGEDL